MEAADSWKGFRGWTQGPAERFRLGRAGRAWLAGTIVLLLAGAAQAITVGLNTEFDDALMGAFANVEILESGGGLDFEIELLPALGPDRDLQDFYFNLLPAVTGLTLSTTDTPNTAYELLIAPPIRGGAGSDFDFAVNFGNGGGPPGNGTLQLATFRLTADQPLAIADLLELSSTSGGVDVHVALHAQSTALAGSPSDSETVGGLVPEPGSVALFAVGLAAFAATRRRFHRAA